MIKLDIISGFLGAGKTTFIKKLVEEALYDENIVLIENEFGEVGIDGDFLHAAGMQVQEIHSGCICCSLVQDFETTLEMVVKEYAPQRIIIEPSGVGKLSDVIKAVKKVCVSNSIIIQSIACIVDAQKCALYCKNFGEFYKDQIQHCSSIVLSRSQNVSAVKLDAIKALLQDVNPTAMLLTTPWDMLSGVDIVKALKQPFYSQEHMLMDMHVCKHTHHHGDEVLASLGYETDRYYTQKELENMLCQLTCQSTYGNVLRAKGILKTQGDAWLHFDYVPGEYEVHFVEGQNKGRLCLIGSHLHATALQSLFEVQ